MAQGNGAPVNRPSTRGKDKHYTRQTSTAPVTLQSWPEESSAFSQTHHDTKVPRTLMIVGWVILAVCIVGVIALISIDHYGFIIGFALMLLYPLLMLAATATATAASQQGLWIPIIGLIFELGCIMWMQSGDIHMSTLATYGGITLVCEVIGVIIGVLIRRRRNSAE